MMGIRIVFVGRGVLGGGFKIVAATLLLLSFLAAGRVEAQNTSTAEVRLLEFGKEIFKSKAVRQYCHKWDASGDQGYGRNGLSSRKTQLTPEQQSCRPGTGMPYHDRFAYTDKRCYGPTREEMGNVTPHAGNDFLPNREVKYLFVKALGAARRPTKNASTSESRTRGNASR